MSNHLNILHLEDDPFDAEIMRCTLEDVGVNFNLKWVAGKEDFLRALDEQSFDIILADYSIPNFNAMEAFNEVQQRNLMIPFVLVTGTLEDELAIECIKAGVNDYVLKSNMARLAVIIPHVVAENRAAIEHNRSIENLRLSEERFDLAVNGSGAGIWDWSNLKNDKMWWSPRIFEMLGYDQEELEPSVSQWQKLLLPEDEPAATELMHNHLHNQVPYNIEFRMRHRNGQLVWVRNHGNALRDDTGRPIRMAGYLQDISDLKQAEALHLDLEVQLGQKHKIEALGLMAGGMAHNFNNNLSIILGGIELTRLNLPGNSEMMPLLDNAKIAVMRSRDLIQNILSYSRKGELNREPLQVALVVDETLKLLRSTIPSTINIHYQPDAACHDLTIQADATRIQEALINLCNNAIQAMDERGELTISLISLDLQTRDIPAQYQCHPGAYIQLSVQDSGCGMTDEIIEKIFDPFFTTKAVDKGTGMGLATLQGMVIQLGGLIKVKSSPGQGSTFELYFPLSDTAQAEPSIINTALPRGSEKIIFLDDNEMVANLGETMLTNLGYQVCTMYSSTETVKLVQANPDHFDLVVTDQTMPDMTGQELIQELRKIKPTLAAILCTGYSSKVDADIAEECEINAFLMKPLELTKLAQTVRKVLDGIEIE